MSKNYIKETSRNGKNRSQRKRNNYSRNPKKAGSSPEVGVPTNGLSHNDPDWYIYDQTMFEGVISMPTFEVKGDKPIRPMWNETDGFSIPTTGDFKLPNVIVYQMNPAAGWSPDSSSPINLMARKMYAELSASNAKTSGYAPEDIAMCILTIGQIIAITEHLRRAYGAANYFNFYNRAVPQTILKGMGFSYQDVRDTLSDFRSRLNTIISRIDTIQFPANIPYFKQCDYIYKNVFVDRDDKMPTYHFMVPYSSWKINEEMSPDGTVLETVPFVVDTWNEWCDELDSMISSLLTSSTFNYVFADVINLINRNVFSNDTIHLEPIQIDYTITPLYSEQFNWQIMNMHILGAPETTEVADFTLDNNVYADTNSAAVIYKPAFKFDGNTGFAPVPVRLPDISIDHREFVECLAYFSPYRLTKRNEVIYAREVALSTYYCVNAAVYHAVIEGSGTDVITYSKNWNSPQYWMTSSTTPRLSYITEPIHLPFFGICGPTVTVPLTKMGSFTQVDAHAVDNLRYQTNLGLFRYK